MDFKRTMKTSTFINKKEKIEAKINFWKAKLKAHAALCEHPTLRYKNRGNTGNYDPSADSHWTEWSCKTCGLRWDTEQDYNAVLKPMLEKYPHAKDITRGDK